MSVIQQPSAQESRIAVPHFKGKVDGEDFTAKIFSITHTGGRWTLSGSRVDDNGVTHKIQLAFPDTYSKGLYKLEDHPNIRLTYSTDSLNNPILRYGASGLIDLVTVDPNNSHVAGGLDDIRTRDDGNPITTITALFSLG
ncbi:hypothetical protein J1G35_20400 [Pseudomonas sp. SH10-3B]|uniref:hypothetical protein n=1 Tax=Pseudomonas sp. SH10-3B TaxID=2816049 RepID=UPI001CA747DB|nr:hypothetical protein [Pseudomonas sp. SH10-3B]MBY8948224.1 hypothetical protein [Pseudomonas sp. SH10-3B]